jgi:hypothetical protein
VGMWGAFEDSIEGKLLCQACRNKHIKKQHANQPPR